MIPVTSFLRCTRDMTARAFATDEPLAVSSVLGREATKDREMSSARLTQAIDIAAGSESPSCGKKHALGIARAVGLPDDMADQALRRVTLMAVCVGTATFLFLVLDLIARRAAPEVAAFMPSPPLVNVARWLAVGDAVMVVVLVRYTSLPRLIKLDVGLTFEVLGALALALTQMVYTEAPNSPWVLGGISPVAIWILLWRMLVPTSPVRAAIAVMASAAMVPLAQIILADHQSIHLNEITAGTQRMSTFSVAAMAWFASRIIYQMGTAVTEARQLGAYTLDSLIGRGGMGEVWRASHRLLKRPAAIKLIRPESLGSRSTPEHAATLERFEQEAQATANLESPHTVQIYDFGETDDGSFYYVMELLDGVDLETLVERHGPMPAERVVFLLEQVCHSLGEAHDTGLTHRDIKPANIIACRQGGDHDFAKVLDFGLVKVQGETDKNLTADGITTGTPAYMAPELALGREVGPATDLYMLGCVAYWLLTGTLVFDADSALGVISAHIKDEPAPMSGRTELAVPPSLEDLVMDCLAKDAADRPESARALRAALAEIQFESPWTDARARSWWARHHPDTESAAPPAAE